MQVTDGETLPCAINSQMEGMPLCLTSLKLHLHSQEGGCDVILWVGHGGHASLAGGGGAELGGRVGGGGGGGGGVVGMRVLLASFFPICFFRFGSPLCRFLPFLVTCAPCLVGSA